MPDEQLKDCTGNPTRLQYEFLSLFSNRYLLDPRIRRLVSIRLIIRIFVHVLQIVSINSKCDKIFHIFFLSIKLLLYTSMET